MLSEIAANIRQLISNSEFDKALAILDTINVDEIDEMSYTKLEYYFSKLRCYLNKNDMVSSVALMDYIASLPYKKLFPNTHVLVPPFADVLFIFISRYTLEYPNNLDKLVPYNTFMNNYGYLDTISDGYKNFKMIEAYNLLPYKINEENKNNSHFVFLSDIILNKDKSLINSGNIDIYLMIGTHLANIIYDDNKLEQDPIRQEFLDIVEEIRKLKS